MYRLLKIQRISFKNTCNGSILIQAEPTEKLCSFCRVHHLKIPKTVSSYSQFRHQTTIVNTALLPVGKKVKRKTKKYAELLEVTENTTSNRRAAVRKINASQLSLLANQPDITLDKLHRMKRTNLLKPNLKAQLNTDGTIGNPNKFMEYQSLSTTEQSSIKPQLEIDKFDHISVAEELESSGIADSASIIKSKSLLNSMPAEQAKVEIEEETEVPAPLKIAENKSILATRKEIEAAESEKLRLLLEKSRRESLIRTLHAYLRVCVSCGMTGRAYHTIMHYRKRGHSKTPIVNTSLCNILLHSYATSGNLPKVKEFLNAIKNDGLEPTAETYAAVFECYSIMKQQNIDLSFLREVQSRMTNQGITFDDILKNSKSRIRQYEKVLKVILLLDPKFQPTTESRNESYDCVLLNDITPDNAAHKSPAENLISIPDIRDRYMKQLRNEMDGNVEIKSIEKFDSSKPIVSYYKNEISKLEESWRLVASKAFDRDLKALKNREHKPIPNAIVLYPCLSVLDKEEYVRAILREIWRLADGSETFSPSLTSLCKNLGKYINDKYEISESKKNGYIDSMQEVYLDYCKWYVDRQDGANNRTTWQRLAEKKFPNFLLELESIRWPVNLQISIGRFLYGIILKDIKLDVNAVKPGNKQSRSLPAFYTLFRSSGQKHLVEEIKPHPILSKIYRESQPETLTFDTSLVPAECPPRPWSSIHSGGYLLLKTDVVRVPMYAMEQWKRLDRIPKKQLWPSLDCLNQLGSVPWTVNTRILDLAINVFREGGSEKLNVPRPPSVLPPVPLLQEDSTDEDRNSIAKARMEYKRKKGEMYSLWCDALYRLSLANHFRGKIFWLPHNMDFRGRVYPIPPHLNHLGSDLARSMLVFAQGKPLGKNGLDWLKIHCINLTGFKKREPVSVRLKFANEIIDTILDSARNPMTGEMWWATSDEPWQTLAACMEIETALRSPDPENYVCRFPIHQDGSCNGLQHYAALGRDQIGAENVNLHPSEVPQDVYSSVAAMVDQIRSRDASNGIEVAQVLEGFVKRKVIKQTVMTTVYGVTKFGAKLQIARQLRDIDEFPQEFVWSASLYLAQKTFESLRTMFESARMIQDWFTDCARVISTMKGQNMEWITPLGLPVVQPYSKVIPSRNGLKEITMDSCERPNTMKQKNAFAPNFVHSLDSCHMMLTSLYCENAGITFVSVHDCYWTHPCTVEIMNKICREQFVALHSQPILEDLSEFFMKNYLLHGESEADINDLEVGLSERKLQHTLTNVPKKGNFDLRGVLNSTYFFS